MSWTWEIPTGKMFSPDGTLAGTGYAGGNLGTIPVAVNNPAYIKVPFAGPLPPGKYKMVELVPESHLGPNAIRIDPIPDENGSLAWMYGRSDFFIHADRADRAIHPRSGSEGCIAIDDPPRMDIWRSDDHDLGVVLEFQPPVVTTTFSE